MSDWRLIPMQGSLGSYTETWDELNRKLFHSHPMLSAFFVNGLLQHFSSGEVFLCIEGSDTSPTAMCLVQHQRLGVWATFMPSQTQIGPSLIRHLEQARSLIGHLPGLVGELDLLCQDPAFVGLPSAGSRRTRLLPHAKTISIELQGSFESYWQSRPHKLATNMRRYERRIDSDGLRTRFQCLTEPGLIDDAVARYAALESSGWKGAAGTALTPDNHQGRFYAQAMRNFGQHGTGMVFELWLDETLVASRLVSVGPTSVVFLKTTYSEAFARYAPGRILLMKVLEQLFQTQQGKALEFYTNADHDLLGWATHSRDITHVSLFRSAGTATLLDALRHLRLKLGGKRSRKLSPNHIVQCLNSTHEFPEDLRSFMRAAESDTPQLGPGWFQLLMDTTLTPDQKPRFLVLRLRGHVRAVLPVRLEGPRHVVALGNFYTALYAPRLAADCSAAELALLLRHLSLSHPGFNRIQLAPLDRESTSFDLIGEAMRLAGMRPFPYFSFGNWFEAKQGDWQAYLDRRSANFRSNLKRASKRFDQLGGQIEILTDESDVPRGLQAYETVYTKSWKRPEPFPRFIPELLQHCAKEGWLRLGVATLNGAPVAAQIWFVCGKRAEIYKVAYDESFKDLAAGTVLTGALMQHALTVDQVHEVDYLIGDDDYKKRWLSQRRERWGWIAYNPGTLRGMLLWQKERLSRWMKTWLHGHGPQAPTQATPHSDTE